MLIPHIELLDQQTEKEVLEEGFALLDNPGLIITNRQALEMLSAAGARVDHKSKLVKIPRELCERALDSCPSQFALHDLKGEPKILYGGQRVQFAPGSSALTFLDRDTNQIRPAVTRDLVDFIKVAEVLEGIDAQSTAMVCSDVPAEMADLYRLYLVLSYSSKPVITGAFQKETWQTMRDMLVIASGSQETLKEKPLAAFDVCPSSPLSWSDITCQNLLDCANSGIPIQIISMPMAGATSPVTLAATVVLHTAECLSGVVLAQTAQPGAPVVWGGSPAIFDMKAGTPPLGAAGSWMLGVAYAQIGRSLGLPTQTFMGLSDAKVLDAQAGMEAAAGTLMAALAGVNLITGAGMLDFENCHSLEKLILDADLFGLTHQVIQGLPLRDDPIALELIRAVGHQSDFISQEHTFRWFKEENYYPTPVIDRLPLEEWIKGGSLTAGQRAHLEGDRLLARYQASGLDGAAREELRVITSLAAKKCGLDRLPDLPAG
jgi:trimethylamine--corrinoid protein Co-methyltransferase